MNRSQGMWRLTLAALAVGLLAWQPVVAETSNGNGDGSDANGAAETDNGLEKDTTPVGHGRMTVTEEPDFMTEEWIQQIKQPTDWFQWYADLRLRWAYLNNGGLNGSVLDQSPAHEFHYQRYRARVGAKMIVDEMFQINGRLTWEGWYFFRPGGATEAWQPRDAIFDQLNFVLDKPNELPIKLTVGRQDVILGGRPGAGGGWLVLDGTPLDGSRTIFLDAGRLDWEIEECQTTVRLLYIEQSADPMAWLPLINDDDRSLAEEHKRGVIAWVDNKSLLEDHTVSGYFMYVHNDAYLANGNNGDLYTVGTHWAGPVPIPDVEGLTYYFDLAGQFGNRNSMNVLAMGFNGAIMCDTDAFDGMKGQLIFAYEYLSGDDPGSADYEGFDILFGRWARFGDLYAYRIIPEGRIADFTNMHRFQFGYRCHPTEELEVCANYHLILAPENVAAGTPGFSANGSIRGHLFQLKAIYDFNAHVSMHGFAEFFVPDDYYTSNANELVTFLRLELMVRF